VRGCRGYCASQLYRINNDLHAVASEWDPSLTTRVSNASESVRCGVLGGSGTARAIINGTRTRLIGHKKRHEAEVNTLRLGIINIAGVVSPARLPGAHSQDDPQVVLIVIVYGKGDRPI
jgi:hypothetical protein